MPIPADEELRNYLDAAIHSRGPAELLELRRRWHSGRHSAATSDSPGNSTPTVGLATADVSRLESRKEAMVRSPTVDSHSQEWRELKDFWSRALGLAPTEILIQMRPFLESDWDDIRDAAVRSRWAIENRSDFEKQWPRSLPSELRDTFLQILLLPASQSLVLREELRQQLRQSKGGVADFRRYLRRVERGFPSVVRGRFRELHSDLLATLTVQRVEAEWKKGIEPLPYLVFLAAAMALSQFFASRQPPGSHAFSHSFDDRTTQTPPGTTDRKPVDTEKSLRSLQASIDELKRAESQQSREHQIDQIRARITTEFLVSRGNEEYHERLRELLKQIPPANPNGNGTFSPQTAKPR
ncbi:MAG: hypothetical protein NT069_03865 [Planctomycetota bacterium]|nr:hypothetical protein [Planctomycetota bacterium]